MDNRLIATVLFASFLVSISGAASPPGDDMNALLNSAQIDMQCRISFETGFMNAVIDALPFTDSLLNPRIDELQSDESKLNQYSNQGDAKNYSMYLQETFSKHLKQNGDAVKSGFESMKNESGMSQNETKDAMESLAETYKSLREDLETCFDVEEYLNLVISHYDDSLNRYQSRAQNLSERGINSSNLLGLVEDARSDVLIPMQNDLSSAENSSELRMLSNKYCLYGGCGNGTNFHMAEKFETMRLGNLMAAMAPEANRIGLGSNVSSVWSSLDAAKTEINSWETDKDVSQDDVKAVWTNIHSAAKGSHDIFIALNSSTGGD